MNNTTRVNEILKANGLDFTIEKAPLVAVNSLGKNIVTPYYGLINSQTGEVINTCKAGYTVSQNADVVGMVLKGVDKFSKDLTVTKAGSINGGRRVFMQLEINGTAKAGTDLIKRYVTVIDSNDGSTSLSVGIGDLFMHCQNQFFKFYKAGNAKFRHTATLNQKIMTIPSLIKIALQESMQQVEIYNKWASTPLTKNLADKMVKHILGYDKVITSTAELAELSTRSVNMMDALYADIKTEREAMGDNLLALFNGVTRFTTHNSTTPKRDNGHAESLLVGSGYKKNIAALEFCLAQ